MRLSADHITGSSRFFYELAGNVSILKNNQLITSHRANYNTQSAQLKTTGKVTIASTKALIKGNKANLELNSHKGNITKAKYYLFDSHMRGTADNILFTGKKTMELEQGSYTSCPSEKPKWSLTAKTLYLDRNTGEGEGRHMVLKIKDAPIFYTPYLTFPIDDRRKSGFLFPTIGESVSGTEIEIPYYWNISPNKDITFTPHYLSHRGLQLKNEFRYLGKNYYGEIHSNYLANDRIFNEDRSYTVIDHKHRLSDFWQMAANMDYASDEQYFEDLGSSIDQTSLSHTQQRLQFNYRNQNRSFVARVQTFQIIDTSLSSTSKPYQKLPQLSYEQTFPTSTIGINSRIQSEYTYFQQQGRVTGSRAHLRPSISLPILKSYGHFTPRIDFDYTYYAIKDPLTGISTEPDRATTLTSLDTGLVFERNVSLFDKNFSQTLEPRLYYLFSPKVDQQNLPLFDTGLRELNFNQLFTSNRFTGKDRIGDSNQVTVALTSRLLHSENQQPLFSTHIGQILYFEDREVGLTSENLISTPSSEIITGLTFTPNIHWSVNSDIFWSPEDSETTKATFNLQYRNQRQLLNLSHRYRKKQLDQSDISFYWPVTRHWDISGRWNYSYLENRELEWHAGLKYNDCCWAISLLNRSYITGSSNELKESFYLELELKGLSSVGHRVNKLLKEQIKGYK